MQTIRFVVEQAGCESCGARVREALAQLVTVNDVSIDEATDTATVVALAARRPALETIDAALAEASQGSGHVYRVQPGSLG